MPPLLCLKGACFQHIHGETCTPCIWFFPSFPGHHHKQQKKRGTKHLPNVLHFAACNMERKTFPSIPVVTVLKDLIKILLYFSQVQNKQKISVAMPPTFNWV